MTLDDIVTEANIIEAVDRQIGDFDDKLTDNQGVNRVTKEFSKKLKQRRESCSRCGCKSHFSRDRNCTAKEKNCLRCGLKGHFRIQCRTKQPQKRKIEEGTTTYGETKRPRRVNALEERDNGKQTDYIFNIDGGAIVNCKIGGVDIKMLVDT